MTDATGQEGRGRLQAVSDSPAPSLDSTDQTPVPAAAQQTLLAQVVLDETPTIPPLPAQGGALDELLLQDPLATSEAPLETAAGPGGPSGGGSHGYDADFGQVIGGLDSSGALEPVDTLPLPLIEEPADETATLLAVSAAAAAPGNSVNPSDDTGSGGGGDTGSGGGDETGSGGGDDTGSGGGDDTGSGGGDDTGSGSNPSGPGADQALFTQRPDTVDFNDIEAGGYLDGSQYDALAGNDIVILPANLAEALEAGFAPGTLFLAGNGHDQITGGGLADAIDGGNGHDLLIGAAGDDTLLGSNGHDTLQGDDGNDLLQGGNQHDLLLGGSGDDSLLGDGGRDSLAGGDGRDLLQGGGGNDSLAGDAADDTLVGGAGRDTLDGGLGDDLLQGGNQHDLLLGGDGDDVLFGEAHNDTLIGGGGDDILSGGSGKDVFVYSLSENEGHDTIIDFDDGKNGDSLRISDVIDLTGDGVIDVADLDAGAHSVAGTADSVVITFDSGTTITLTGIDGSGVSSFDDLLDIKVNLDVVA
ncbi:MAG: hypothetical protein Kow00114_14370 [Kiloniellaceae bacterium]